MYILLVGDGARLATSNAERVVLWDVSGDAPSQVAEVVQKGQRPFFTKSPAGERLTAGAGLVARSYTPLDAEEHWTRVPTHVGIYRDEDLSEVAQLALAERLDHETLALSPDGGAIASTLRGAGPIAFDAKTGEELWRVDGSIGSGVSWCPTGAHVAAGSTDQGPGQLFLIQQNVEKSVAVLPPPSSKAPLYDSPYRSAFAADGSWVVFTCAAWGAAGVTAYDTKTYQERWAQPMDMAGDENAEFWDAPEVGLAFGDTVVLAGQLGRIDGYRASDGHPLSVLQFDAPDGHYFAADSKRRCIWVTRDGAPTQIPMPDDWR